MSDTDVSELDPRERETIPPPPPPTEPPPEPDALDELRRALAHCSNLCIEVLQRLDLGERRFAHNERRLDKIERHLGIKAAE